MRRNGGGIGHELRVFTHPNGGLATPLHVPPNESLNLPFKPYMARAMLALVKRCCLLLHAILALLVPGAARASAPCSPGLAEEFRFHASAPVVDAHVSGNGSIALMSIDGYVHALRPNGRFLWSYTLDSSPISVDIGRDGRVYAASDAGMIHVLRHSGEREWGGQLPAGMVPTGKVAHSERGVVFVPSNLNVYAFSVGSGLLWRAFIGSTITSGPVIGPQGDAWVVAQNGEAHRIRTPSQRSKFSLAGGHSRIVAAHGDQVFFLDDAGLSARRTTGEIVWTIPEVEQVTSDLRVVRLGAKWVWIDAHGERVAEREVALDVSSDPAHAEGRVYVPGSDGRLYVFGKEGAVEWCQVAHAPLLTPQVHADSGAIVVGSGDGWLVSIRHRTRRGGT